MMKPETEISTLRGLLALSPVVVFMLLYVGVSVALGDFYKMPVSVALLTASVWSILIFRGPSLSQRIETFSKSAGNPGILYMIWVFILAGAFAALAVHIGAVEAMVNMILSIFPAHFVAPMLFVSACLISFSIGTSVGTVVALAPLAVQMSAETGALLPLLIGAVLGGAFFGDNLSFISDTTIAATRSQGCDMSDKFRANALIAIPAAVITLGFYLWQSAATDAAPHPAEHVDYLLMVPYLVVILAAISGINVCIVLTGGIITGIGVGLWGGYGIFDLTAAMGGGVDGMGDLIIITLLASGMLGIIKAGGGIRFLLERLTRHAAGSRRIQGVIVIIVSLVNLCTANNTVAIITVGGIARDIAAPYHIAPRKVASLLDTASCIVQCLIPYSAQTLLATQLAGLSPAAPFRYLYYPWALAAMVVLSIIFINPKNSAARDKDLEENA